MVFLAIIPVLLSSRRVQVHSGECIRRKAPPAKRLAVHISKSWSYFYLLRSQLASHLLHIEWKRALLPKQWNNGNIARASGRSDNLMKREASNDAGFGRIRSGSKSQFSGKVMRYIGCRKRSGKNNHV